MSAFINPARARELPDVAHADLNSILDGRWRGRHDNKQAGLVFRPRTSVRVLFRLSAENVADCNFGAICLLQKHSIIG